VAPVQTERSYWDAGAVTVCAMSPWPESSDRDAFFPADATEPWTKQAAQPATPSKALPRAERLPGRALHALQSQLEADRDELVKLGLDVTSVAVGDGYLELEYCAADREATASLLTRRYGPAVCPVWLGPSRTVEVPKAFGSWIAENTTLTVFYGLDINTEQAARVLCVELRYLVIVTVTVSRVIVGPITAAAGSDLTHSMIELEEPLGDRLVLDAAAAPHRPRWL
jgi:hypothetical protein